MTPPVSLQDWYRRVNAIYLDRNFYRTPESVFVHLVEVIGGLSIVASGKQKPGVKPDEFLAKSFGWWIVLCGKVGVRNVEDLLWAKFPYACPYCQSKPHNPNQCNKIRRQERSPKWEDLRSLGVKNVAMKPTTLAGWMA